MEVTVGKPSGLEDALEKSLSFTRKSPNQVHRDPELFVNAVGLLKVQLLRMPSDEILHGFLVVWRVSAISATMNDYVPEQLEILEKWPCWVCSHRK